MEPDHYLLNFGLTPEDMVQLLEHGISLESVKKQMGYFEHGFPELAISGPATLDHGVLHLSSSEVEKLEKSYHRAIEELKLCKFVPASGAASRMFKDLLLYLNNMDNSDTDIERMFTDLHKFAFYDQLKQLINKSGQDLDQMIENQQYRMILQFILGQDGLNYHNLPKALIPFHQYQQVTRNALEEHLEEAAAYARFQNKTCVHFTMANDHEAQFKSFLKKSIPEYQRKYNIEYEVTLSVQNPSTDTVAVDSDNMVFRGKQGQVVVRPGGHGALLENLNRIESDIIFIKNIDNVAPDHLKASMIRYKKALVGILWEHQAQIFQYLRQLDELKSPNNILVGEIEQFAQSALGLKFGDQYDQLVPEEQSRCLYDYLNRPLRVCSVIRTKKQTGGGPYWVLSDNGDQSLQILENAQLNETNSKGVVKSGYAHITDLVCGVRNYKGVKFDLRKYADPDTGFITEKSHLGTKIKIQEHPGLWNGSMSNWNTMLLEVPDSIFHPVKSVWDLLTSSHQPESN